MPLEVMIHCKFFMMLAEIKQSPGGVTGLFVSVFLIVQAPGLIDKILKHHILRIGVWRA